MVQKLALATLMVTLLIDTGCTPPAAKPKASSSADHGHSHESGKKLLADAGKYHAALTAHLSSKDGNELDIFFETTSQAKPVALPLPSFKAEVQLGEELKEITFEPAPADERPKDEKPGTCSHFVAKAPWMKPTDNLYVVVKIPIDGKEETIRWKDFNPKKYAHHED